jgi:hypothetical protein
MKISRKIAFFAFSLTLFLLPISMTIVSTCLADQGQLIWESWVYSSGVEVVSPVLDHNTQYRIVASEIWWYNYPASLQADAQYYTTVNQEWNWVNHFPEPNGHSFLQIDGQDVDWGPFSNGDTGHTYTIYYIGQGYALTFKIVDWLNGYENNVCHLPVKIYKDVSVGGYVVDSTLPSTDLLPIIGILTLAAVVTAPIAWYSRKSYRE